MSVKNIWSKNNNEGYFRKQFNLEALPDKAYVRIFVDTGYELFINGRLAAAVDEWCNTRDYEISAFLKEGTNLIAVHGINHAGHRAFALELAADGETLVVTDETWKVEEHEKWGWILDNYDDSLWDAAQVRDMSAAGAPQWWTKPGSDFNRVIPTLDCSQFFTGAIPKTCRSPYWTAKQPEYVPNSNVLDVVGNEYDEFVKTKHLPDVLTYKSILNNTAEIKENKIIVSETQRYTGPSFIVDFGKETVGFFRMKIQSQKSVSFRLYYGETLDEAMSEPSRDIAQNRMLREEYRVFGGEQEFESRMKVGMRFVRVEFFDCEALVETSELAVRTALYPVARKGYFSCSDADMTKLWETGERTLHYCMQEYYYDAPKRDRFLWTGDTRLQNLINYYTFGDTALFEFCWHELAKVQYPDGGIPASYGEGCSMLWDYIAWYVIASYDYYMYVGNTEFVSEHKENIYKATDYLTSLAGDDGIINVPKNPMGKLWMVELNEFVGKDPYLNELYLRCLETAKLTADLSKDNALIEKYTSLIENTKPKVEKLLDNDSMTKLFGNSGSTQIQYELAELDLKNGKITEMMERIRKYWVIMLTSGSDCLHEGTRTTEPIPRIDEHHTDNPSFVSYCHAWTAAATALLPMGIAGIKPLKPGFEKVEIKPQTNIFDEFCCVVPTPSGEIAVKYSRNCLEYFIPDAIMAQLVINDSAIVVSGRGRIVIK